MAAGKNNAGTPLLRVIYIALSDSDFRAGSVLNQIGALIGRGHDVELWSADTRVLTDSKKAGIPSRSLHGDGVLALRHAFGQATGDIVVVPSATDAWKIRLALALRARALPIVLLVRDAGTLADNGWVRFVLRRLVRHVLTGDEQARETVRETFRLRDVRVTAIAAAADLDRSSERLEFVLAQVVARFSSRRKGVRGHWRRLQRSLGRRRREWQLPGGYRRLGTKYGGWWVDAARLPSEPLLIDCGLGLDISFPSEFLSRFGGTVIGIDANPQSLEYCRRHCPPGMEIVGAAFWSSSGETLTFYLPRRLEELSFGADAVSGSLARSNAYAAADKSIQVATVCFEEIMTRAGRGVCDVLKLDIEGAEYPVLHALCESGRIRQVRQLLVEFHHGCTERTLADTDASIQQLRRAGFELVHMEDRNYIFRRTSPS
jgi:FkbM family methyltransferase